MQMRKGFGGELAGLWLLLLLSLSFIVLEREEKAGVGKTVAKN